MIRSFYWHDGKLERDLSVDAIRTAFTSRKGVLWVDFEAATDEEAALLGPALFDFHPLAVEDCHHERQQPKVDDFEDYLFLIFHAWARRDDEVFLEELDVFLGPHWVVSYHEETRRSVNEVVERIERDPKLVFGHGADLLLHNIVDRMVDRYQVVVEDVQERSAALEDEVLTEPTDDTLRSLLTLKKDLQRLFRTIRHQRDVIQSLSREGHAPVSKRGRQFFRDIYDHVLRTHDTVEGLRDEIGGARDAYLSAVSNRMNEIMKKLTLVATVVLPLSFITGFFGMNFQDMPGTADPQAFWITCGFMVLLAFAMVLWFRRKGWA